ncbi:N-alpha-acetyltransferase 40 [Rhizopus stolonifer]|uniref:N-alpha-acetyltransferase 40 n=1 Tax=Rhizopus stolonifer TaxID=4846 RepID=A0A367KQ39_RHIST|nr:N-alpha-acetyltransferase 40 [Rhizopus stolonifer]
MSRYDESYTGWNELGKRHEMLEPQTRYLIARSSTDPTDKKGFLSFQMTREETLDDYKMDNTAYCYEIQIEPHAQNQGLGGYLMNLLYQIGCHWKMDKVMLTVFKANQGAFRFYTDKLGFELDPISPSTCLPLYRAKKFDYDLLSKPCQHH